MDPHLVIRQIIEKKPLPIPEALGLVTRLAPGKIDLYDFHRLPIAQRRARLLRMLEQLLKTAPSQMPVVQIAQQVMPRKQSVQELLAAEFGRLEFVRLPDTLKLLVIRRYECKRLAVEAHAQVQQATTREARLEWVKETVRLMAENWEIWAEIEHYHRTGSVLGKRDEFKLDAFAARVAQIERELPALQAAKELLGMMRTAANRIYKLRSRPDKKEITQKWIARYNILATKTQSPAWGE